MWCSHNSNDNETLRHTITPHYGRLSKLLTHLWLYSQSLHPDEFHELVEQVMPGAPEAQVWAEQCVDGMNHVWMV